MTSGPELIRELQLSLSSLRAEGAAVGAALESAQGIAADSRCQVTVEPSGRLRDITFSETIASSTPPQLGESVMAMYGQALTLARQRLRESLTPGTASLVAGLPTSSSPDSTLAAVPPLPGGEGFLTALRQVEQRGTDALLAASPFPRVELGPGLDERMRARFAAQALAAAGAREELARIRTRAESDTVVVEVDAAGSLMSVRIRAGGPRSGPVALRQAFLDTLQIATLEARAEARRILVDAGLESRPGSGPTTPTD